MSDPAVPPLMHETGIDLQPDHRRVITRFFVPGREDIGSGDSRAAPVVERILQLDEASVHASVLDLEERFGRRHRDLRASFEEHAAMVFSRIGDDVDLTDDRRQLLGASFTHEYSIEGAALCNPSAVLHPEQPEGPGARFVMSVRGIGEGHRSSIGFRTGTVTDDGVVTVDRPGPFPHTSAGVPGVLHRSVLHAKLAELGDDRENAGFVLDSLPDEFDQSALWSRIDALYADKATRRDEASTSAHLRSLARSSYDVEFPEVGDLSERVLWPQSPAEYHGMEDARFVRFTDDDGTFTYYGTYTAFDGLSIAQHLVHTDDFRRFRISPMSGGAAVGKGLALFPRRVAGRFMALSRWDRESNALAASDDLRCWEVTGSIQLPDRPWELLQLGNCGSPIETDRGWLVLTHGVGPMRSYCIGALLLDLDDPSVVLARSVDPILSPVEGRRDGYVPNVVYSCGGFAHGDVLVLPYAVADQSIRVATTSVRHLLDSLTPEPT